MSNTSGISLKDATLKAASYCSYRERTHQELRNKLYEYGLYGDEVEEVIISMITDGFLNEERYAKAYAGGKFRINNWGKVKIKLALTQKKISTYCIQEALKEIDDDDYEQKIGVLIEKKANEISDKNGYIFKNKIANYLINKGYETELVWNKINEQFPHQ